MSDQNSYWKKKKKIPSIGMNAKNPKIQVEYVNPIWFKIKILLGSS